MKKRIVLLICVIGALLALAACGQTNTASKETGSASNNSAYQSITATDGKELLENATPMTLVDVRTADEYEEAHIPSAINIPNESIEKTQPPQLADLDKTLVVYCRSGARSKQAADKLVAMGYTDVRDMGGIIDWPYETVSGPEPGEYAGIASNSSTTGDTTAQTASAGLMSNFSAQDLEGNSIDQSILADYDLTMVNVWATYCGPCLEEMPDLGELAAEYDGKGLRIVGMVSDVSNSDGSVNASQVDLAKSIATKTGANYMHIVPTKDLFGLLSQISVVPTTFFVDASGAQVGSVYLGSKSKAEWNDIIVQMLGTAQ